jgi:hypothetical protein
MSRIDNSLPTSKTISKASISPTKVSPDPVTSSPIPKAEVLASPVSPVEAVIIPPEDDWMYDEVTSVSLEADSKDPEAAPVAASSPSNIEKQDTSPHQDPVVSSSKASDPPPSVVEDPSESKNQIPAELHVGKVFTKNQLLPLTFHVLSGPAQKSVQKMITVRLTPSQTIF